MARRNIIEKAWRRHRFAALLLLLITASAYGSSREEGLLHKNNGAVDYAPLAEEVRRLFSDGKGGEVEIEELDGERMRYAISQKPSRAKAPSILKGQIPFKPSIKAGEYLFITYRLSGGRLGDNLLAYSHAKWIAMKYGLPLIVHPFKNFERFELSNRDFPRRFRERIKRTVEFTDEKQLKSVKKNSVVVIPYFVEQRADNGLNTKRGSPFIPFAVDWEDPAFRRELVECLAPSGKVASLPLPEGKISIAIHIRRGGDYENNRDLHLNYPLKAPLDEYYIGQLKLLSLLFPEKPLYIYLFTDDLHPEELARKYFDALGRSDATFDWMSAKGAASEEALLSDFFSMGEFDCLIRSASNFSLMAGKRGRYTVEAEPLRVRREGERCRVDKILLHFNSLDSL